MDKSSLHYDRQMVNMKDIWTDRSSSQYDGQMVDVTDIWTDRSCWGYDRQLSSWIHLNHTCDVTPPQSTVLGVVVLAKKI